MKTKIIKISSYIIISLLLLVVLFSTVVAFDLYTLERKNSPDNVQFINKNYKEEIKKREEKINSGLVYTSLKLDLASAYFADNQTEKALKLYDEISKNDIRGNYGKMIVYYKTGNYEKAIENSTIVLNSSVKKNCNSKLSCKWVYKFARTTRAHANRHLKKYPQWFADEISLYFIILKDFVLGRYFQNE